MKEKRKIKETTDEEVDKMLRSWDKIKCYKCGKIISLLNARSIDYGMFFVCKEGCEDLEDFDNEY